MLEAVRAVSSSAMHYAEGLWDACVVRDAGGGVRRLARRRAMTCRHVRLCSASAGGRMRWFVNACSWDCVCAT